MISTPIKVLIGVGVAGAVGGGSYGIYLASRPGETVLDVLSKQSGITVLRTKGDEDNGKWDEKVSELAGTNPTPTLENYVQSTNNDQTKKAEENRENLKNICRELFKEDSSDAGKLAQARKWCTKENSA